MGEPLRRRKSSRAGRSRSRQFFASILLGIAIGCAAWATPAVPPPTRPTFSVRPTQSPIRVDGVLDEPAWSGPPTFTLDYETDPAENTPAPVRTAFWITYDSRRLYVAVRADDPNPRRIRARLSDRDKAGQDDFVGVVLDTFDDGRRAFEFFVNPLGVQMDLTENDITGNEDSSWDAIWDSAGRLTEHGFEVEMAIPFSSLRFPRTAGPRTWGIDAVRVWPREVRHRIGLNPLPRGRICYLCYESKLSGFAGITPGRNVELDPTLTGSSTADRPDGETPFHPTTKGAPGLTARWGVTPGLTLNAALNPDFSQVEADVAQLAVNTQFALFYPEKRPFFLEGADLFDTKINAVYTRDIADPDWGLKLAGKEGSSAYGAIVARDARTNFLFPGSQRSSLGSLDEENLSSILRFRHDLGADNSSLGLLWTGREGSDYHNRVLGFDSLLKTGDNTSLRLEGLGSSTAYPDSFAADFGQPPGELRGYAFRGALQRNTRDWTLHVDYNDVSPDFRDDLGFIPRVDYRQSYTFAERNFYFDDSTSWFQRLSFGTESTLAYDHEGRPQQQQVAPYLYSYGRMQSFFWLYLGLGPSYYQDKRFSRTFLIGQWQLRPSSRFYTEGDWRAGEEIDYANARPAHILRVRALGQVYLGRHLNLQLQDTFLRLTELGGELFHTHLLELRSTYQFTPRTFVRWIAQYFAIERDPRLYVDVVRERDQTLFNQLLFSYKLNPQTVFFLGYSDGYVGDSDLRFTQTNRTIFVKLGYALVF